MRLTTSNRDPPELWESRSFPSVIGAAAINALAMYIPVLADALHTGPIPLQAWGALIALATSVLVVMEIYKRFRRPSHSMC